MVWPNSKNNGELIVLIQSVTNTYPRAWVAEVGELYKVDLPSSRLLQPSFIAGKPIEYCSAPLDNRPNTLIGALQSCDKENNTFTILVIACTLPVTPCETERSSSQLKLLKTYLHSTMTENRLS